MTVLQVSKCTLKTTLNEISYLYPPPRFKKINKMNSGSLASAILKKVKQDGVREEEKRKINNLYSGIKLLFKAFYSTEFHVFNGNCFSNLLLTSLSDAFHLKAL